MRVEERQFAWELMRVEKREFAWEYSQLSCPGQREQELHESWWELTGYYHTVKRGKALVNSHPNLNQLKEMRVDWILLHMAKTLMNAHQNLNQLKEMRVDWILLDIAKTLTNAHPNLNQLKVNAGVQTWARVTNLINSNDQNLFFVCGENERVFIFLIGGQLQEWRNMFLSYFSI